MYSGYRYEQRQHGSFTVETKLQTIEVTAFGAWNEQTSRLFKQIYLQHAEKICQQPWACLLNLLEWELGTAEILQVGQQLNAWSAAHQQCYSAVVCGSTLHRQLIEHIQEPDRRVKHEYFSDLPGAQQWLTELGYYPSSSAL